MSAINSPMSQLAQMYNLIEANLRRAATNSKPMSLNDLNSVSEIKDKAKSVWQVRDCVAHLSKKHHVIPSGTGRTKSYIWDLNSPPFILQQKQREKIHTQPSVPAVVKHHAQVKPHAPPKVHDYELVIGSTMITIGKNPVTGNMRLTIEEVK